MGASTVPISHLLPNTHSRSNRNPNFLLSESLDPNKTLTKPILIIASSKPQIQRRHLLLFSLPAVITGSWHSALAAGVGGGFDPVSPAERDASLEVSRRVAEAVELLERGRESQAQGDYDRALQYFTQVVTSYKDFALSDYARVGRAIALYEVGDKDESIAEMEDVSISLKGYPEVHAALAAALYSDKNAPVLAENQFTIATILDPHYTDLSYVRETKHWPPSLVYLISHQDRPPAALLADQVIPMEVESSSSSSELEAEGMEGYDDEIDSASTSWYTLSTDRDTAEPGLLRRRHSYSPSLSSSSSLMTTCRRPDGMIIKAQFGTKIMIFELPVASSLVDLEKNVTERLLELKVGTFRIKYLDDEGDWILITDDDDLHFCMASLRSVEQNTILMLIETVDQNTILMSDKAMQDWQRNQNLINRLRVLAQYCRFLIVLVFVPDFWRLCIDGGFITRFLAFMVFSSAISTAFCSMLPLSYLSPLFNSAISRAFQLFQIATF